MNVPERLAALRSRMKEAGVDAYLVPTEDFHGSEYVGEYFKCRKYITGFTGSAGTAVVMQDMAGLWTDGRYFLQAEDQLKGSGITLFKMREPGVPTVAQFLISHLKDGQTLGCDGRTITSSFGRALSAQLEKNGAKINPSLDLVGDIWPDRPALSAEPVWILDEKYTGKGRRSKIADVRAALLRDKADELILTSLDDIAWLLNIRGNDVECNPVVLSYLTLTQKDVTLYVNPSVVSSDIASALKADGVGLRGYNDIYEDVRAIPAGTSVLIDPAKVNYALRALIPENVTVLVGANPTTMMKACKTPTEMENIVKAHIEDGVALTKFIYWVKTHVGKEKITEISAGEKLEEFRKMGRDYLGPSFEPIVAFAEHGAIIHYSATPETDVPLEKRNMLLVDSGGQYLEGTTDVTRTIVLGKTSAREKEYFTRVLRGHLDLAAVKFKYGCSGKNFDYLARAPLWEVGEDYNHGTGHGVGYCLNVHEGPNSFHYTSYPGRNSDTVFEEGMLTSDEPGFYPAGEFGIRHENLLLCRKGPKTALGQFMYFEIVTLAPFDLEAIVPELLGEREIRLLNEYHRKVYDVIGPRLNDEERAWLREATRAI